MSNNSKKREFEFGLNEHFLHIIAYFENPFQAAHLFEIIGERPAESR